MDGTREYSSRGRMTTVCWRAGTAKRSFRPTAYAVEPCSRATRCGDPYDPQNTEFSGEPAALPSLVRCNSLFASSLMTATSRGSHVSTTDAAPETRTQAKQRGRDARDCRHHVQVQKVRTIRRRVCKLPRANHPCSTRRHGRTAEIICTRSSHQEALTSQLMLPYRPTAHATAHTTPTTTAGMWKCATTNIVSWK
jgi:hypothetical protein